MMIANSSGNALFIVPNKPHRLIAALLLTASLGAAHAEIDRSSTEEAYLGEFPVILSVTRLSQPLADTPGAVTIIDRDMIHRSGAREVAELLRFVPGFIVSSTTVSGANPVANYHSAIDEAGVRMQVLIDGRSVYSPLYFGDTHRGLMGVVLEDIERIEVFRGSNSAAYGANAFLGVINIVTRNTADTQGVMASVTMGNQGVNDNMLRYGWGSENAHFRLTTARRSDSGTNAFVDPAKSSQAAYDDKRVSQAHFRADLQPSSNDDLLLQIGNTQNSAGKGLPNNTTNPLRNEETQATYVQARWSRALGNKESITLAANFDEETYTDEYPVALLGGKVIGSSGYSRRHNLEFSHSMQARDDLRLVWGANWRHEMVRSYQTFNQQASLSQQQSRLFSNVEWRPAQDWVINAGGMLEHHSAVGTSLSPRLMLNYHVLPEHTLRLGATKATRSPALFEQYADQRAYNAAGVLVARTYVGNSTLQSERITSREIGYLGEFRDTRLTWDVRAYQEDLSNIVVAQTYTGTPIPIPGRTQTFGNAVSMSIRGVEQQLQWKPRNETRVIFSHAASSTHSDNTDSDTQRMLLRSPQRIYSLMWLQKLPYNLDYSLMYTHNSTMSWNSGSTTLPAYGQIDMRLAYPFKVGTTRAELAMTTQAINGSHLDYKSSVLVSRRSFISLRLEY